MNRVIDSSVAMKWALPEIDSDKALQLLSDYAGAVHELLAPDIFPTEVSNALVSAEKSGRITIASMSRLPSGRIATS